MSAASKPSAAVEAEEEEDDYMTMTFTDAPAKPETSLQRRQREKREAEKRRQTKSKAELAAEEAAQREAVLGRSLLQANAQDSGRAAAQPKSKGLAMMARMGFAGGALGAADNADARTEPLPINIREGRGGACAAGAILLIQTMLNVFGTVDLLPLTGVTFPFVSNGGSSMIACWGLLAFIKAADTRQNASVAVKLPSKREAEEGEA